MKYIIAILLAVIAALLYQQNTVIRQAVKATQARDARDQRIERLEALAEDWATHDARHLDRLIAGARGLPLTEGQKRQKIEERRRDWLDQLSGASNEEIRRLAEGHAIYLMTGTPPGRPYPYPVPDWARD